MIIIFYYIVDDMFLNNYKNNYKKFYEHEH
jgi:hypothetical protein